MSEIPVGWRVLYLIPQPQPRVLEGVEEAEQGHPSFLPRSRTKAIKKTVLQVGLEQRLATSCGCDPRDLSLPLAAPRFPYHGLGVGVRFAGRKEADRLSSALSPAFQDLSSPQRQWPWSEGGSARLGHPMSRQSLCLGHQLNTRHLEVSAELF